MSASFVAGTRFFVLGKEVIACPPLTVHPATGNVLYSPKGKEFYVALGQSGSSEKSSDGRYSWYNFYFDVPELNLICAKLEYSSRTDTITWGTKTYGLNKSFVPTASTTIIGLKPVMEVLTLVLTGRGYIVQARNRVDNETHAYFDGRPVTIRPDSSHVRGDVETLLMSGGHRLDVSGSSINLRHQTALFDGEPAQVLDPKDFVLGFADDLRTVSVKRK